MNRPRATRSGPAGCQVTDTSAVPTCAAGPGARALFVARELVDVWHELRGHARRPPADRTHAEPDKERT